MKLTLRTAPSVPLEADTLCPDRVAGLTAAEVTALPVFHGNQPARIGDFFSVTGSFDGVLEIAGDLARVKLVGAGMRTGRLVVDGPVGAHLGAQMAGGEIVVTGDAGDWVGREMSGGRIIIHGGAGQCAGSAVCGSPAGIQGGEIIIHGNAGDEVGNGMRRGLIAVGGDCGDFAAVNLLAGTVLVLGRLGARGGAGMKRGSLITMHDAELLPTFTSAGVCEPGFLRLYLRHLAVFGLPIDDRQLQGRYRRYRGDALELNKGEILVLDDHA